MSGFTALVVGTMLGYVAVQIVNLCVPVLAGWVLGIIISSAGIGTRSPFVTFSMFGTRFYIARGVMYRCRVNYILLGKASTYWRTALFFLSGPLAMLSVASGSLVVQVLFAGEVWPWQATAGFALNLAGSGLFLLLPMKTQPNGESTVGAILLDMYFPSVPNRRPSQLRYLGGWEAARAAFEPVGERRVPAVYADFAALVWGAVRLQIPAATALKAAEELRDPTSTQEERLLAGFARGSVHRCFERFDAAEAEYLATLAAYAGTSVANRVWLEVLAAESISAAGRSTDAEQRLAAWDSVKLEPAERFLCESVRGLVRLRAGKSLVESFPIGMPTLPATFETVSAVWLLSLVADALAKADPKRASELYRLAIEVAFADHPTFDDASQAAFVAATDDLLLRYRRAVKASGKNASDETMDLLDVVYEAGPDASPDVQLRLFRIAVTLLAIATLFTWLAGGASIAVGRTASHQTLKLLAGGVGLYSLFATVLFGVTAFAVIVSSLIRIVRSQSDPQYGSRLLSFVLFSLGVAGVILVTSLVAMMM